MTFYSHLKSAFKGYYELKGGKYCETKQYISGLFKNVPQKKKTKII